ncbi:MAG: phage head morphogenesis protein, partial [Zhenhengia sp.]
QICRDMDGKTFKLSEKVVWLNYPPLHCRCRSTTVPYFEDKESYGKRIARDYEGKVYYVPEEMTYHEWYDKYVKGNPDELLLGGGRE